jgi:hypothetical protein
MTSPPGTPDQDRAGHTPSGVSFSPTAVVAHTRHCVAKEIGRASKVDGRDARINCRENEKNRERRKTSSSQNTKGGLSVCIMAQFMIAVLVPA